MLWLRTAEVVRRDHARRWVPENTAWDVEAKQKLYRAGAEQSLAYWLDDNFDDKCTPRGGTGKYCLQLCWTCSGSSRAELTMAAGFVHEHTLGMVS